MKNYFINMAPRLSAQTSIFGVVVFVSKSLLGIVRQKKLEKFTILTRKPWNLVRILIYRTWPFAKPVPKGTQIGAVIKELKLVNRMLFKTDSAQSSSNKCKSLDEVFL